jgi:hypothetical protein
MTPDYESDDGADYKRTRPCPHKHRLVSAYDCANCELSLPCPADSDWDSDAYREERLIRIKERAAARREPQK